MNLDSSVLRSSCCASTMGFSPKASSRSTCNKHRCHGSSPGGPSRLRCASWVLSSPPSSLPTQPSRPKLSATPERCGVRSRLDLECRGSSWVSVSFTMLEDVMGSSRLLGGHAFRTEMLRAVARRPSRATLHEAVSLWAHLGPPPFQEVDSIRCLRARLDRRSRSRQQTSRSSRSLSLAVACSGCQFASRCCPPASSWPVCISRAKNTLRYMNCLAVLHSCCHILLSLFLSWTDNTVG